MRLDGPDLAHGWLAVAPAMATEKDAPAALHKAVTIEEYATGVRLIASDGYVLVTAWVPDLEHHYDTAEPDIADAPERTVVASDRHGRARGLLGHVLTLAGEIDAEDYAPGNLELSIDFDVRAPAGSGAGDEALEGMEATFVVLAVPDVEKVYLEVVEAEPLAGRGWRNVVSNHEPAKTEAIVLNPDFLGRVGKVGRHATGAVSWEFGGSDRPAMLDWTEASPHVSGIVMPRSRDDNTKPDPDTGSTGCAACDAGTLCLRHSSGVVLRAVDLDTDADTDGEVDQ
ncbi:hypothetical protein [Nocardioides sp. Leaf374]|uniref:hypothetical protein n=1 Tax=Nocardioides sp. Leaf374 TaxID=2876560 RepID=UPI001E380438|nr:hypothetical protein [Nocardioides sp. Leaf374]